VRQGYIVCEQDGRRVPVRGVLLVGRTRDCGFSIDDGAASRKHLEIIPGKDGFTWRDLGSTNGTLLNGAPMLTGELRHGDRLQIGETVLRFEEEESADSGAGEGDSRVSKETVFYAQSEPEAHAPAGKPAELLEAVYAVVNEIATNFDPCRLTDRILETTMNAIRAQRGAIFLARAGQELGPCPSCGQVHLIREGVLRPAEHDEICISRTVAQRVLERGESVLYQDTAPDAELSASESIMSLHLRSIVCVPLRAKHGILGILYIDSDSETKMYTEDDLLLAAAVGNSAGLAIENAQMHQEILEKQRIEQEIAAAWTIQEGFLVKEWPDTDRRFQVYGRTFPAKTVGGDFYDFVQPEPDVIGLFIGDVSGKGVPAALTMAQLLAAFRLHARSLASPAAVLRELNEDLARRSQRGMFCTLCYLRLDLRSGALVCANAGHPAALRIRAGEAACFGEASGPPAGILEDAVWEDATAMIAPGDTVLLYTDGIIEARNPVTQHGPDAPLWKEFELSRLQETAAGLADQTPQALVEAANAAVQQFCAPGTPHDDCTMIAVRYLGHGG